MGPRLQLSDVWTRTVFVTHNGVIVIWSNHILLTEITALS